MQRFCTRSTKHSCGETCKIWGPELTGVVCGNMISGRESLCRICLRCRILDSCRSTPPTPLQRPSVRRSVASEIVIWYLLLRVTLSAFFILRQCGYAEHCNPCVVQAFRITQNLSLHSYAGLCRYLCLFVHCLEVAVITRDVVSVSASQWNTLVGRLTPQSARGWLQAKPKRLCFFCNTCKTPEVLYIETTDHWDFGGKPSKWTVEVWTGAIVKNSGIL